MRFQSKNESGGAYAPIKLDPEFPVADPDWTLRGEVSPIPPHAHDCFEIGYCHEGTGVFIVEDKILSFRGGDTSVINNRELHLMKGDPQTVTKWNFLNLDPVKLLAAFVPSEETVLETFTLSGPAFNNVISGEAHPEIRDLIKAIIREAMEKPDCYKSEVRALVWALMVQLHRIKPAAGGVAEHQPEREKLRRISPALEVIAEHYAEPLTMEKLAARCRCSVSNFRKLFHAAVGRAPLVYVGDFRMKAATALLENSRRSILDIALSSGYPTLSNFNRQFKERHGMPPRQWRRTHGGITPTGNGGYQSPER